MKFYKTLALLSLIWTTQTFANYEVIGETKECAIQTKVIQKTTDGESSLLVIHESDIYELDLERKMGSIVFYKSSLEGETSGRFMTFEATVMGPEMSRLSELKIFLSGVMLDCLIDK